MATIFLSYRRTDSPQACRVYDWLAQRFGHDAIFMDVEAIPFAISFPDFIRQEMGNSKVLITLIGPQWVKRINQENDPVRSEIELAIGNRVPVLPVLIGNTPMPSADELPASISVIAYQNAAIVGVSHDFHSHMQFLLPKIESILGALTVQSVVTSDPDVIYFACEGLIEFLRTTYVNSLTANVSWKVIGTDYFLHPDRFAAGTLFLHRVARLAESLELHFILSFWSEIPDLEQRLAGWVIRQFEQTPIIPNESFAHGSVMSDCNVKVRISDEDPRKIWSMISDDHLRLSLAYVATVSPKQRI